ncbi:MAG: hypothetical protein IJ463_02710 [Bacilli bacterium]|nr:hypothetical protein [Bacilli bacterium]
MRMSIFNLNNNDTYKDEYIKIIKVLNSKCITIQKKTYSYFDYINTYLFNNWKYRNTYIDCYEYLKFIGVNVNSKKISLDAFINLIEFILNIQILIESNKYYNDNTIYNVPAKSIIFHNIPLILDKLNYQAYDLDDKVMIFKKDIDYEDLFSIVPDDINELILSYSNINNNGIKTKRIILNKLYNYLLSDIEKYKSYNSSIFSSIKLVINKMGVVGDIDKKYQNLSNYKLRKYYDYCFNMMTYLLRTEAINKYKEELKSE